MLSGAGGLIEPMLSGAGGRLSRCTLTGESHRTIDPYALKIPAPQGRNLHQRRTSLLHFSLNQNSQTGQNPIFGLETDCR